MLEVLGNVQRTCDGISRRQLLQAGGAGMLGMNLCKVLSAEESNAARATSRLAARATSRLAARAKGVIFVFLYGGPSQLETLDMKPDAPGSIRGPFRPIGSRTPGLRICEHLPKIANRSNKLAVVRTVHHTENNHNGTHFIQTGRALPPADRGAARVAATDKDWPAFGSVISYLDAHRNGRPNPFPPYVYLPRLLGHFAGYDINGQYAGWLGKQWNPLATHIRKRHPLDNPYFRDCTDEELDFRLAGLDPLPEITLDRLDQRRSLLKQFDAQRRHLELDPRVRNFGSRRRRAFDLLTSGQVAQAFDIRKEDKKLRDSYGRNLFGQSMLLARRLIEAGSRFVTVGWDMAVRGDDTTSWDSHRQLTRINKDHLLPTLDQGLPALLDDMSNSGLLDETLVFVAGEMGRTPKFENRGQQDGRDHWSYCFPCMFAGAGIRGGTLYGDSDKHAAYPVTDPVTPADLAATIYWALGISPETRLPNAQGQPVPLVEDGHPLSSLFG